MTHRPSLIRRNLTVPVLLRRGDLAQHGAALDTGAPGGRHRAPQTDSTDTVRFPAIVLTASAPLGAQA